MARASGSDRTERDAPGPATRRWSLLAALSITCAVAGAVAVGWSWRRPVSPVAVVVDAVGESRTVEARLTGGFAFAPLTSPTRDDQPAAVSWRVLAAAGQLQDAVNTSPTPANLHALGVAALQARRYDEAVLALEDALAGDADNAAYLSDLAAAYLARQSQGGPALDVPKALTAADRAVLLAPRLPEAQFNRALALSALHVRHEGTRAWDEYLQAFGQEAGWSDEARRRRDEAAREPVLLPPSPAAVVEKILDEWAAVAVPTPNAAFLPALSSDDALYTDLTAAIGSARGETTRALAQAVADLRAADAEMAGSQWTSGDTLAAAVLARGLGVAPLDLWARRIRLSVAFYVGRAAEGRIEAERMLPELRQRGYRALEADVVLRIAAFDYSSGAYDQALAGYQRVTSLREAIGDLKMGASARLAAAEALRTLGRVSEAWEQYLRVLSIGALGDVTLEQVRLQSPTGGSAIADMPHVALALGRECTHLAEAAGRAGFRAICGYLEARALNRLGDAAAAERRLGLARAALGEEPDETLKRRILPELSFAEAEILWATKPALAVTAAQQAAQAFGSNSTRHRLLALAVLEARAHRRAANLAGAEVALLEGVAIVEEQQRLIGRADFLPSFIDATWDVFAELVDLKASQDDAGAALQWLDRGYDVRRHWQAQAGRVSWRDVSAAGPVVAYLSRPDALWVWVVRDGTVTQRRVTVSQRALVSHSARLARLLTIEGAGAALPAETAAVAADILWPATSGLSADDTHRLALVLDPVLQHIPFALLPWSQTSARRVVDVTATVVCPSVMACASAPGPDGVARTRVAALYSSAGDGELAPLPLARVEAERIGRRHAGASVDVASEATLIAELGRADVVHFAGHAAPDERYPGRSMLVVTDASGAGVRVPLGRLLASPVSAQTVLLSACRTSAAEQRRGHGGTGVAGEFLRAGVRHVVATQWDVQDLPASDVMDLVHEALAGGAQPWDAVRHAQQVLSQDPNRRPRDWAGYVAFTATSAPARGSVSSVSMPPRAERP